MTRRTIAVLAFLLIGAAGPPRERVVSGDGIIAARLDGDPVRLRIDPAAPGMPLMATAVAEARGLKMGRKLGIGFGFAVGPTRVMSKTQVTRIDYGSGEAKQRVGWTPRAFAAVADGTVGPGGLPDPIVRFVLRPAIAGERTITLPMESIGFPLSLFGGGWAPSIGILQVGGAPMRIRFDPYHARTLATAGAAVRLAKAYGGALSGEPVPTEIFFGVERPVRDMTLQRPLSIGALAISRLGVRTGDFGSTGAIREAAVATEGEGEGEDPDEIVVTAKGKKRDLRHDTLSLGADALAAVHRSCSTSRPRPST